MESHPQASLLGLPRELRLLIYEHVMLSSISARANIPDHRSIGYGDIRTKLDAYGKELDRGGKYMTSWSDLMQAHPLIAHEVRDLAASPSEYTGLMHTYTLELYADHRSLRMRATILNGGCWMLMPCRPTAVRRLNVVLHIPAGQRMEERRSLTGAVARQLFYTIYLFTLYGPLLGGTRISLCIDELVIDVARTWPGNTAMLDSGPLVFEDKAVQYLKRLFTEVIQRGIFYGCIGSVRLLCQSSHLDGDRSFCCKWVVKKPEQPIDRTANWEQLGVQWGASDIQ